MDLRFCRGRQFSRGTIYLEQRHDAKNPPRNFYWHGHPGVRCPILTMPVRKKPIPAYRVFRLKSWDDFLNLIVNPPYSHWAFRGERDERWPLFSSLSRYLQSFGVAPEAWTKQESRILRVFKRKAHQFLDKPPELDDDFQW